MAAPDLLDPTLTAPRARIRIDGVVYPLRRSSDLTLHAFVDVEAIGSRLETLVQDAAVPRETDRELSELLARACRHAVLAPPSVLAALSDPQRLRIAETFTPLLSRSLHPTRAVPAEARRVPGTRRSRGCSASTVAPSRAGGPRFHSV